MASFIVKVSDGTDIRRFTARSDALTYLALKKRIAELYDLASFKLQYTDDEGDQITMTSEEELQEAITQARKMEPSVLRLKLKKDRSSSSPRSSSAERDTSAARPSQPAPSFASTPEVTEFINHLTKQLPSLVQQLPEAVQRIIPNVELDVSASLAATAADAAAKAAATAASCEADYAATTDAAVDAGFDGQNHRPCEGFHPGVSCDRSGQCPIVGTRYHLRGHNYDLCEAEYSKLSAKEKAEYVKILPSTFTCKPPAAKDSGPAKNSTPNDEFYGVHVGVTCDKSGESPIVGYRYHLPGHNYDLNQTEYDKLSSDEKSHFQRVRLFPNRRGDSFGFNGCGGGFSPHFFGPGWSQHSHHRSHHGGGFVGGGGRACRAESKWAARFVCDLSIHDGTQMAASTKFTKIWRMKNVGEVPWPAGAKLLFVAGDKMSAPDAVLVSSSPVAPGEEIDIAVDMTAPEDLGRYMGYFRLVGPHGRRKFGQRVWCHIQVVDESSPALSHPFEMEATEMEKLLSMPRGEATDGEDAEEETDSSVGMNGTSSVAIEKQHICFGVDADAQTDKAVASDADAQTDKAVASDADAQTDKAVASDADAQTDQASNADADAQTDQASKADTDMQTDHAVKTDADAQTEHSGNTNVNVAELEAVKTELTAMGFSDDDLLNAVLAKHGASLEECAQELASLSEWDTLLTDLEEMGFNDRDLNRKLLVQNAGSLKKTVKTLVTDSN